METLASFHRFTEPFVIMSYKDGALVFTIEVYIFSNNLCLSLSPLIVLDI